MRKNIVLLLTSIFYIFVNLSLVASVFAGTAQTTNPDEYKEQYSNSQSRIVHLPSGAIFKIKDIEKKEFMRLLKKYDILISEYNVMISDHFYETRLKRKNKFKPFLYELIVKSVEEPSLCIEDEEDKLQVGILIPDDFDYLCKEIEKYTKGISKTQRKSDLKQMDTKLVITDLILSPERYEGKTIDITGVVTHEMKELIISYGERKIIFQRFCLSDRLNTILVFWFCKESERLKLKPGSFSRLFGNRKDDNPWKVKVRRGKFTTILIPRPVIIGHSESLYRIKDSWIQKIHGTLDDYR